jgi:hypothetical protein
MDADSLKAVDVQLELEMVEFGSGHNAEDQILAFAMFGIFGLAAKSGDTRLAIVQWRATAKLDGDTPATEAVGIGYCLGPTKSAARRTLVPTASRRALYDALAKLAQGIDAELNPRIRPHPANLTVEKFQAIVDGKPLE